MGLKTDYSFLFDSLNGKSNSSDFFKSVNLSEYNNIKSGVYKKVLNAYYDKQASTKSDKKTDKKVNIVSWIIYSICLLFCYNVVVVYFASFINGGVD